MILTSIDNPASKFYYDYNKDAVFYNLLIADKTVVTINAVWADLILTDIDTWSETKIHTTFKNVYRRDEAAMIIYEKYLEFLSTLRKIRASKHLDKEAFRIIAFNKKVLNDFKMNLIYYRDNCIIEHNHVKELISFVKEGVWQMIPIDYEPDANKEDELISPLVNTFYEKGNMLSLDNKFVDMLRSTTFDAPFTEDCDFIKIPLWFFPPFEEISFNLIKYTRDNLQAGLVQCKTQLNELSDELNKITFASENFTQIRQLFNDKLMPGIQPVQSLIDESIYLNLLKNKFKANTGYHFYLGIAPAETLVDIFEKTETIQPYVASEIKNRIERQFDLQSCCVFSFLEHLE